MISAFITKTRPEERGDRFDLCYKMACELFDEVVVIDGESGWYYIGQTANLDKRFRVHRNGKGSWVTREYPPLGIVETRELGVMTTSEAMLFENDLTLEYMGRYGVDKVRGGHFIQRNKKHFAHLLHR